MKQLLVSIDTSGDINVSVNRELRQGLTNAISQVAGAPPPSQKWLDYATAAARGNSAQLKPILDGLRDNLVVL